jgi:predicted TIM-barrel fold metal-dependent hydrolase
MIIDANAFIGKWPYWPVRSSSAQDLLGELQSAGIDSAAICSTRSVFVSWRDGNEETAAEAAMHKPNLIPFACLGTQELSHALNTSPFYFDSYRKQGFRGVRLYPQHHSYHLLFQKFVDEILEGAKKHKWPVLLPLRIIMNWGVPSLDPTVISALVERHPKVTWILAGVNYLYELQMATSLMLKYENVFLETSCVMGYAAIEKTVALCGYDQILFGSGAPLQHAGAGLSKIVHAKIAESAREAILGKNFNRVLEGSAE